MWELITQARNTKGSIRSCDILESTKWAFLYRHNRGITKKKREKFTDKYISEFREGKTMETHTIGNDNRLMIGKKK